MVTLADIPNPSWMTEEHVLLQDALRTFVAREVRTHTERWQKQGVVDRELWTRAGDA